MYKNARWECQREVKNDFEFELRIMTNSSSTTKNKKAVDVDICKNRIKWWSSFYLNGYVDRQNCHIRWATEIFRFNPIRLFEAESLYQFHILCFIQKRIGSPCTFWTGVGINSAKGFTLTILRFRTFVVLYRKNSNSERDNGSTIKIPRFKAARAGSRISIKFYCYIQLSHILLKSVGDVSRLLN